MPQLFLTYPQQLHQLKTVKKMIIPDPEYAQAVLEQVSYYSLIGGYKNLFKDPVTNYYKEGVTFKEIVAFYCFDEELRTLFLKYMLHVERHIKSLFSYFFCEKYGIEQDAYLNNVHYNLTKKNAASINRLTKSISKSISRPSHYPYITHHANTYNNVPLWVTTNALSFGQISKMYQYATTDIRTKISKKFLGITEKQLHQLLNIMARCRNVCAHGERLYSFRIREAIPDTPLHSKLKIVQKNGRYTHGKQDLFAVTIALRYLIDKQEYLIFINCLKKQIRHTLQVCPHISEVTLLKSMGFPSNWEHITRYKTF